MQGALHGITGMQRGKKIFKMKAKGSFGGSTGGNAEFKCQKWNSKTGTREK